MIVAERWERVDWDLFAPRRTVVVARAPGRLDVMGGIADYSGATVLELPLAHEAIVAIQPSDDGLLTVHTGGPAAPSRGDRAVTIPAAILHDGPPAEAPERLRAALEGSGAHWAAYVLGPLAILVAEGLLPAVDGLRLSLWSDVPAGAGVSSSAALEVGALRAVQGLFALALEPLRLARLAQQAEHRVALAPCGIMDQATATLGRKDQLLMLRCQPAGDLPAEALGYQALPRDVQVLGIDSAVAHRVGGGQYGRVRTAAFMGRAIISHIVPSDPPRGYLCNVPPDRFGDRYAGRLPVEMSGVDFLARYGETGDDATRVDPDTIYRVRDCTAHPIYEAANIRGFVSALNSYGESGDPAEMKEAGEAMYASHRSYGERCGLGTPETDLIVELVREQGPARGLYGAKITGGGGGGTVAILGAGDSGVRAAVDEIAAEYARRTGHAGRVIAGSSDGAWATPVRYVSRDEAGAIRSGEAPGGMTA